jgi:hypothetical protein
MPSRYFAEIAYPGGQYIFGDRALAVGETAFFDLRKIRNQRMPDANGDLLPATVTSGQFRWHSFPAPGTPHMIGRAAVSSLSSRISASYSCVQNCGANGPWYLIDGSRSVLMSGYQTMSTRIGWQGVYTWSEYNTNMAGYPQMDNTSIADLGAGGSGWLNVDGLGIGDTFWSWTYSFEHDFDNGYDCDNLYEDRTDTVPTEVQRTPHHLKVGNDLFGSTSCNGVRRVIDFVVVDQPGTHPVGNISVIEDPDGPKTDSCSGLGVTFTTSCSAIVNSAGIFEDNLKTGCPGSGTCGFDVPFNKWRWCNGAAQPSLAALSYLVHYHQIKVNGSPSSLNGTEIFP